MSSLIGALRVTLGIDTAQFSSGMTKAEGIAKRSVGAIKGFIGGFASGVGAAALLALSQRSLEYVSSLEEVAQQLGVTTNTLQEYRYAASQTGVEQETMDKALAKLTVTIGKATTGGKAQAAVFNTLGINLRDANGHIRDTGAILPEIADALAKIPDPARRAAIEVALFGKAGQKLDPLLSGGSAAINGLRDAAHSLGIVMSEEEIRRADELADKLSEFKQVLEARIAGVVTDNANSILLLVNAMGQLVIWAGKAAQAFRRFKLEQGINQSKNIEDGWFSSKENVDAARRRRLNYQAELTQMDRTRPFGSSPVLDKMSGGPLSSFRKDGAGEPLPAMEEIDLSTPSGGGGGKGGGPTGPSLAEIEERFRGEAASLFQQYNSGLSSMAKSAEEQAEYELRNVELAHLRTKNSIETDEDYSKAQKEQLLSRLEQVVEVEREKVEWQRRIAVEREIADLAETRYQNDSDALQVQFENARTQDERRRLALEMVDLEYRHRKALLEATIASETVADVDKEIARLKLQGLEAGRAGTIRQATRDTAGPLESYLDSLPRSAAEVNEALESVATGGIQSIVDGLAEAMTGARSLGDVFKNVAKQIIADLLRIQMQKAIVSGISSVLGGIGIGGGFNASASLSTTKSLLGQQLSSLPGFASGGSFRVGGNPGVDTNLLSINGQPRARVSAGEQIAVIPPRGGLASTGAVLQFDLRNAVMTPDLLAQMNKMAQATGMGGAMAGANLAESRMTQRARRQIR